jgi:hypothetical protein
VDPGFRNLESGRLAAQRVDVDKQQRNRPTLPYGIDPVTDVYGSRVGTPARSGQCRRKYFSSNQAFLAFSTPITLGQAQAQLFALTRQMIGLMRLLFDQIEQVDDT